jgi:hypothetical protein
MFKKQSRKDRKGFTKNAKNSGISQYHFAFSAIFFATFA